MKTKENDITNIVKTFDEVTNKPEDFISAEVNIVNNVKLLLKQTYDFAKKDDDSLKSNALPELIIENFDTEQIWQQIELQNEYILSHSITAFTKLITPKRKLLFDEKFIQDENLSGETDTLETKEKDAHNSDDEMEAKSNLDNENQDNLDVDIETESDADDENEDNLDVDEEAKSDLDEQEDENTRKFKKSVVDDKFFKLGEMNNFLLSEEKKLNKPNDSNSDSDESIDMFKMDSENEGNYEDIEGNDKRKNPRYKDFFGTKTQQLLQRQMEMAQKSEPNESDADENNMKSSLELREERLQSKIRELENNALSAKPWQLKGEIMAENRPQNSLLEEVLEFDISTRPAPVITESTTHVLEDVIRQRIKDKAFDDVERKIKPVETPLEYKKKLMLDQEKSKQSLAQIYEKEYIEQKEALTSNEGKEEEEPTLHKEIKIMMRHLFTKLDALSNFHFTPKPAAPELKIVSNLPAISMEEVAPVAASNAALLAPEEIKHKLKGDEIGKGERTDTDKNRERRKKRRKQKEHVKHIAQKANAMKRPGLGNKYSKEKVKRMLDHVTKETNVDKLDESYRPKSIKSSTAFFTQLQDEVKSQIKNKIKTKRKGKDVKMFNAKKLKL